MCEKYFEYETKLIHLQLMRITPAGAGKTKKEPRTQCYRSDHPRRCGENHVHGGYCRVYLGSPPQVRGKQKAAALDYLPIGITPADAGKTLFPPLLLIFEIYHPRGCGENFSRSDNVPAQ